MSQALAREYGCRLPTVIFNAFAWKDRKSLDGRMKDRKRGQAASIHWYSQTLGHGRGLEDLLGALSFIRYEAEIHLRGRPVAGFSEWLASRVPEPWRKRIFTHDLVPNDELLSRIAEHDIGFAGEMNCCRSRDLTVTNKILHYLLGGLAVVASDTAGQREIAEQTPGAVAIYPSGDAKALAERINALLEHPQRLVEAKASALRAAESAFCWERMEPLLVESVQDGLCNLSPGHPHAAGIPNPNRAAL
ncbi:MAG: glycosyltransferase [Planctomycetes bacterium]|nr:glycosyltransferase [Planctomycetota bacterium]